MKIKDYFENAEGLGVLATADSEGRVDAAMYSRPHVIDEKTVAFIMLDRLTHHNLQSNQHAAYLFLEKGDKLAGKRLFLTKIREERGTGLLESLRRRPGKSHKKRHLVFFRIDRVLPLVGGGVREDSDPEGGAP